MYYLQAEASFDGAHFLKGYAGKCSNLHGHRWRVIAQIQGRTLQAQGPKRGMLRDFGELKEALGAMAGELDHRLIIEEGSLGEETVRALEAEGFSMVRLPFPTTAENMAKFFYDKLRAQGFPVSQVQVYETPTNCACYTGEEGRAFAQLL